MKVLVLSATSDIARGVIRLLAARGDSLLLAGRDASRVDAIARDARLRGSPDVAVFTFDAADPASVERVVTAAYEGSGGFDAALIAQGALAPRGGEHGQEIASVVQVNLTSAAIAAQKAFTLMSARGSGVIAVLSSVAGDRGRGSNYLYGAAKAGLSTFLDGLRHAAHGSGVRIVTLKPGLISTRMTRDMPPSVLSSPPERIAPLIVRALDRGDGTRYLPGWWRAVMFVVRSLPAAILHRTRL